MAYIISFNISWKTQNPTFVTIYRICLFFTFFKAVRNSIVFFFIFIQIFKFKIQIMESSECIEHIIQKSKLMFYSLVLKL